MTHQSKERSKRMGAIIRLPEAVVQYVAHVHGELSIRTLARRDACHASTLSRRFRRVEMLRDDPLFDAGLRRLEHAFETNASDLGRSLSWDQETMTKLSDETSASTAQGFEQEAVRIMRRMCETGAVLAVAKDMDMAVVVREAPDGSTTRTAVASQQVAQDLALRGWIETQSAGRILRYSVTPLGRESLKELLGGAHCTESNDGKSFELAEAPAQFVPAPKVWGERTVTDDAGETRKMRYNLADSPLTALARRRDKTGAPFLDEELVRCGERLREDFELAQMSTQVSQNWDAFVAGEVEFETTSSAGFGPQAAQSRVVNALKDLGPGLSDVVLRCCCFLEGLESAEQQLGWSARSGKIVLRIALQRLKRHYDETMTHESQLIG